jgi:CheY-like chemotaxis protein
MTLHVLIVEDEADFIDEIRRVLDEVRGTPMVEITKSRTSAFDVMEKKFFDVIILDLTIPPIDGALDTNPLHGQAVFSKARAVAPGTPIVVLTGSPAEDFIPALLKQQQQVDIWGEGKTVGTVIFLKKYKFDEFPGIVAQIADAVDKLSEVELDRGEVQLTIEEDRLIRSFARRLGGTRCVIGLLGGGLSGAKVVRLRVTESQGIVAYDAVAKLGSHDEVRNEAERFDTLVSRLEPSATPRRLGTHDFGARARAGVFYSLASGFELTAFEIADTDGVKSATAIKNVERATKRWIEGVPETRRSVRTIRQRILSDEEHDAVKACLELDWTEEFESRQIQVRWACIHGDLHGSNILVSYEGAIVIIDYGDVGAGPASLDPVTLELSLLFYPQGPLSASGWPSEEQAAQWGNIDEYIRGCPATEFVMQCRGWASRVAAGNREIAASAYAYLMRQLKYSDTRKKLVLGLLEGVRSFYSST